MDVEYFPYDTQTCRFVLASKHFHGYQVCIHEIPNDEHKQKCVILWNDMSPMRSNVSQAFRIIV